MKQSILFENGKLYVVELPEKPKHNCYGKPHCCMYKRCKHLEYDTAQAIAIKNKVEVKNPEYLPVTDSLFGNKRLVLSPQPFEFKDLKDGDTFPLPAGIEVDIEAKECESSECACRSHEPCRLSLRYAILKRIEPEKPEETQEDVRKEFVEFIWKIMFPNQYEQNYSAESKADEFMEEFTIQRKKS